MKSLMSLWSMLAEESASICCTSAIRDIKTVSDRIEHEGLSFLTITLPDFGKAIQNWLDLGQVGIHTSFQLERGGRLPRFLGGFFCRVFDRSSGLLLDEPCVASIRALRQLTLAFGKIELECSPARKSKAIRNYIECELEVREFDRALTDRDLREFTSMSNLLFRSMFTALDRDVQYHRIVPKHGPGSTADGLSGNGKFNQAVWTTRLDPVFPVSEHLLPNWSHYDQLEEVHLNEPDSEVPVKVTLVPKTLKTPRVIAMEPTCMQYMQQGLLRSFLEHWKRDDFLHSVIGFDDQVPNQDLARQGSLDQRTATLDLSDASDRVSNQLVRAMFRPWPGLFQAVDATRSRRAVIPDTGEVIRLSKYASMGSALCFPVEAAVFTTLIFLGIQRSLNTSLSRRDLLGYVGSVRVFGDDLIVPSDHVLTVVQTLEHFGARVGLSKSFWTGKFRESCGREYFNGEDVSIVRIRQGFPTSLQDVDPVQSVVSLRNQLFWSGYWRTCRWLDDKIREVLRYFPDVEPGTGMLGRETTLTPRGERDHPNLFKPLVKAYHVEAKPPRDHLEGSGALLKCLLKLDTDLWLRGQAPWGPPDSSDEVPISPDAFRESLPESYEPHLERSGRPKSTSIKLGWGSPLTAVVGPA
ncbi:TPA_asm: RNA-directed RNA polymerase [ssRNA phage Esthiorhiza.2_2]|uniref:RNA-directed RNA polymerase n=2 Tax=Leviviricetes TaxID=2842243 RepID=A0A8S5L4I7_9VIRU|nr:RNA-directed RNA polymerase [ssRNA phage Esthiorhiza.2_2]QDH86849.1 MAG: RNA-dependent RNA polymerase [Leviviridae sp.]DAD52106.1 TPA_asm: RNA-directed RNA polymerase [ssRNA phage Esthiorhiza.2_2]